MEQQTDMDLLAINTIRTLAIDAIQKANSGHPGTPLDAAPTAFALWQHVLRYDPTDPGWINRDRFLLSAGHASMLLYALIYLAGIRADKPSYHGEDREAITMQDLQTFRQAGSRCPGHPEYRRETHLGVEATTGPLGQGVSNSVGMAAAGRWLAATYNRPGFELFNYNVYALAGDGCMMEGVASESASLAGHLGLSNLCWIYDSNRVSLEGPTDLAFTEDTAARFLAYGWNVTRVSLFPATIPTELARAYAEFAATTDRPTFIVVHSHIGYGSPHKHDSFEAHGEALGVDEVRLVKQFFKFDPDKSFVVPPGVREHFANGMGARGAKARADWHAMFARYRTAFPDLAAQVECIMQRKLPAGWDADIPTFPADPKGMASRDASSKVLNAVAARMPWLLGGAADLTPSTKTRMSFDGAGDFQGPGFSGTYGGRNFHYGVREHAMCAVVNGMTLSGLRAFGAGFLIFTDYARGSIRLASLMELPVIHIWTHDSISLGEDGPTHQPIEQLACLRAIPGFVVFRPADANEVAEAYRTVLQFTNRPAAIVCSRQALPTFDRSKVASAAGLARGAYVMSDAAGGKPDVILIGTGSEVALCMSAREKLAAENIKVRVVSMPCWELFEEQDAAYRESVLPPAIGARVTVEEAAAIGWDTATPAAPAWYWAMHSNT